MASAEPYLRERLRAVLDEEGLDVGCLDTSRRSAPMVACRVKVWRRLREGVGGVGWSYPEIARACGMTSHSTIVHALAEGVRESREPT